MNKIEGHLVAGYANGGGAPDEPLKLAPGAAEDAATFLQQHANTRGRFDKVSALVEGFESSFGLASIIVALLIFPLLNRVGI